MKRCTGLEPSTCVRAILLAGLVFGLLLTQVRVGYAAALPDGRIPITGPVQITTPGSYVLTQNILTESNCIAINTDDVTINLNGYRIKYGRNQITDLPRRPDGGSVDSTPGPRSYGIWDGSGAHRNIVIFDGTVEGFTDNIDLGHSSNVRVENISAEGIAARMNRPHPITVGDASIIRSCRVEDGQAVETAIRAGSDCQVLDNVVARTAGIGMIVGNGCRIAGNQIMSEAEDGIHGGRSCIIEHNVVVDVPDLGIVASDGSSVLHNVVTCTVGRRSGTGVSGGMFCQIRDNTVTEFREGILGGDGAAVSDNAVNGSGFVGISVSARAMVSRNIVTASNIGIQLGDFYVADQNHCTGNLSYGIQCAGRPGTLRDNTFGQNGADVGGCSR